jgi:hypothetical protein
MLEGLLKKLIKSINPQMGLTIQLFGSKHLKNFARNFSQNEPKVGLSSFRIRQMLPKVELKSFANPQKKI